MPIRTDRGRAAALRHFWSWPLRSAGHALVTVLGTAAVITVIAVGASAIQPDSSSAEHKPAGAAGSTTSSARSYSTVSPQEPTVEYAPSETEPNSTSDESDESSASASSSEEPGAVDDGKKGARQTASEFMDRWVVEDSEDTDADEWAEPLMPYVAPGVRVTLKSISPERVPASKVTGDPTVKDTDDGTATVDVDTDAGTIRLSLIAHPNEQWLVKRWEPKEQ